MFLLALIPPCTLHIKQVNICIFVDAPARPPVIPHMGWESPGGTTHFTTPPTFQYEPCYPMVITPMNGGPPQEGVPPAGPPPPLPPQCMNGDSGRGNVSGGGNQAAGNGPPPTLHFHVKPGDPVQLPPGGQVQILYYINLLFGSLSHFIKKKIVLRQFFL